MPILGKRYPANEEEFNASLLSAQGETFDPSAASKRMKIPTPVTWETELSANGNTAANWRNLVMSKKLPFMAMLRNLRNMLITGVDPEVHETV
jgi:telomerase protein component 1